MSTTELAAPLAARPGVPPPADGLVHLRLREPLTASTASAFRRVIRSYAETGEPRLLLDLEDVPAIDASGVAALLEGQRAIEGQPHGVLFLRLNPTVSSALKRSSTIAAFRVWRGPAA
jgi:anti-anti-sigma factor